MSETLRFHYPRPPHPLPQPLPRPAYIVVHSGPIEVGSQVRVIELPTDGEPVEHHGRFTVVVDGQAEPEAPNAK